MGGVAAESDECRGGGGGIEEELTDELTGSEARREARDEGCLADGSTRRWRREGMERKRGIVRSSRGKARSQATCMAAVHSTHSRASAQRRRNCCPSARTRMTFDFFL